MMPCTRNTHRQLRGWGEYNQGGPGKGSHPRDWGPTWRVHAWHTDIRATWGLTRQKKCFISASPTQRGVKMLTGQNVISRGPQPGPWLTCPFNLFYCDRKGLWYLWSRSDGDPPIHGKYDLNHARETVILFIPQVLTKVLLLLFIFSWNSKVGEDAKDGVSISCVDYPRTHQDGGKKALWTGQCCETPLSKVATC